VCQHRGVKGENLIAALQQLGTALAYDGLGPDVDVYLSQAAFDALSRIIESPGRRRTECLTLFSPAGRVCVYSRGS
jgi:hypothetical protein